MSKRKILVTGGAGYVGSVLIPYLLLENYKVTVIDLFLYGDYLVTHKNLTKITGDIRDTKLIKKIIKNHTDVIHLACISNDPSFELNPKLGKSINLDAFRPLVELSIEAGVKRFIYASSSSVYGVKKEINVHEEMNLEPLTDYSYFKAECEKILFDYCSSDFICTVLRPATICGFSPRQRLDVVVNILTNMAYHNKKIQVFGGTQLRPNIHIKDMISAYLLILGSKRNNIHKKIFNVGSENKSVNEIAKIVKEAVGKDVKIINEFSNDNRSYHISSEKIKKELGFNPIFTVNNAVEDLINAFKKGILVDTLIDKRYFNIKTMQSVNLL